MGYSQRRRPEVILVHELVLSASLLLVAVLQTALAPQPGLLVPNIVLLLTLCKALLVGPGSASRWAFYAGIALDICSGSLLGMHALALLAAVMLVAFVLAQMSQSNWLLPLLATIIGMSIYHAILAILISLTIMPVNLLSYVLVSLVPDILVTLIPALPIFLVMRWWHEQHPETAVL